MFRAITAVSVVVLALGVGCGEKDGEAEPTPAGAGTEAGATKAGEAKADEAKAAEVQKKVTQIAAGNATSCALLDDGGVRCWGQSGVGELGAGRSVDDAVLPVDVPGISGASAIALGGDPGDQGDAACATLASGSVMCWGLPRIVPGDYKTLEGPHEITELKGARDITFGGGFGCAIFEGKVRCWGSATFNTMGTGATGDQKALVEVPDVEGAVAIGLGQNHGCAALGDGSVKCWGYSGKKQAPTAVEGIADAVKLAATAGSDETCAITKEGKAICWTERSKPSERPGIEDVVSIDGRTHLCAVTSAGAVHCWGNNGRGQLGNGTTKRTSRPIAVDGIASAVQVSAGSQTTCVALREGGAMCWGFNRRGQLGDGTLVDRHTPVAVAGIQDATAPGPGKATEVQEAAEVQQFDGLPAECSYEPTVSVGYSRYQGDSLAVKSAYAASAADGRTWRVDLANFNLDPKARHEAARGPQLKIGLRFGKIDLAGDKKPQPVDLGVYAMSRDNERVVHVTAHDRASSSVGVTLADLSLDGLDAGTVELKHIGEDWVCGVLDVKTKSAHIKGPFAAQVVAN